MKKRICKILLIMCLLLVAIFPNTDEVHALILKIKNSGGKEVSTINCSIGDTLTFNMCVNLSWDFWEGTSGVNYDEKFVKTGAWENIDNIALDYYVEYKIDIIPIQAGEVTLEFYFDESAVFATNKKEYSVKLIITDPVAEAEKTKKEMEEAYKTVPSADADATAIDRFLKSYALNVGSLATEEEKTAMWEEFKQKVSKDTAKKWRDEINSEMIDQITRKLYMESYNLLVNYINDTGDFTTHSENLANQMNTAINSTQTTINELIKVQLDLGVGRQNVNFTDVLEDINSYIPTDDISDADADMFTNKVSTILTIITNVGMIIAVLMIAIIGVKYMLGSIEEKAEYKRDMIPYLVGAILLFGISTIVKVAQQLGQSINNI